MLFVENNTESIAELGERLSRYNLSLDINDWVRELDCIDPYDIHPNITYDLVMVVEANPTDCKQICMLQFYAHFQCPPAILPLSATDMYDMICNCEVDQPHIPDSFKKVMLLACTEASIYLENNEALPIDLLTKLIKIKIMLLLWKTVHEMEREVTLSKRNEYYAPAPGEGKGGKREGKSSKKEYKSKAKGLDKKGKSKPSSCNDILNKTTRDSKSKTTTTIENDIPSTHLYIILIGFHNFHLIKYLTMNGFDFKILVKFKEAIMKSSLENMMPSASSLFAQPSVRHKGTMGESLYTRKANILFKFWNKAADAYGEFGQYHLSNSFIMNYTAPLLAEQINTSDIYFKLSKFVYFHFLDALKKCKEFRELHSTYLEHLKMYNLGYGFYMTIKDMPHYETTMSTLPLSISNPPFIIEGLLDELVVREEADCRFPPLQEDVYLQIRQESGHQSATRWQPLYLSSSSETTLTLSCDKLGELYHTRSQFFEDFCHQKKEDFICHTSFNDQIKRLLEFHRKRVTEYRKESEKELYHFLPTLGENPFIIHECDAVDLALKYYKYIPNCTKEVWINSFLRHPYVQTCANLLKVSDEDETFYRKQLKDWCNLLELDIDELINCIILLFYGKILCNNSDESDFTSSFITKHFYTQKIHFDSDYVTNIVTTPNSEDSESATKILDNHYEKIIPTEFKWLEDLSPNVALQKFYKAQNDYCCVDRKYIPMFNAVLFRFHNDCDEFGLSKSEWSVTLRTPVSFRDFMHAIVFKDTQFLLAHESKREAVKTFYDDILKFEKATNDFIPEEGDFLFGESLKILLNNPTGPEITDRKRSGKKGGKDPKSSAKGGKKSDKLTAKTKPAKESNPKDIVDKEPFGPGTSYRELAEDAKVKNHIKKLMLPGLDYDEGLLGACGSTTTFHSLDEFSIAIDKCKITNCSLTVSASIKMNGNTLYIHKTLVNGFAFHVNLKNGGIIAFGKPSTASEQKMRFYLVEELRNKRLHCLGGTIPKRRETIMAAECFYDNVKYPEGSFKDGLRKEFSFPGGGIKRHSKFSTRSITSKRISWMVDTKPARIIRSVSSVIPIKRRTYEMNQPENIDKQSPVKLNWNQEDEIHDFTLQGFVDDIMQFKQHLPIAKFKILSSPLHRFSYISRKRSNLEIELADVIRYVLSLYRSNQKYIRVKRAYDLNEEREKMVDRKPSISFGVTLPNGLHLKNVFHDNEIYIIQNYMSKGPENADVANEKYRLFLRDGSIAIRELNGKFFIYQANGEIVRYSIPLNKKNWSPFFLFKKRDRKKESIETLLESVNRRVRRMHKNVLEDYECSRTVSRIAASYRRKQFKFKKALILKEIKFKVIAYDGTRLYYHNGNVKQSYGFRCEKEEQFQVYQTVFKRSDGTISIFNNTGVLETKFPDGTRILSWCDDRDLLKLNLRKKPIGKHIPPFTKVNVYYQYEHPKYAAVTYDTASGDMKFDIPGDVQLQVSNNSCSVISDRNTLLSVDTEKVVIESIPCEDCNKYCICKVNSKPLFRGNTPSATEVFLKAKDSFNKSLMVYFNGNIKRNSDYVKKRMPCVSLSHRRYPPQKVMLLFNDLRAKYLWSETMYANRMADMIRSENTQLVLYVNDKNFQVDTTEIRAYESNFYNGQFRMDYLPSTVINNDENPTFKLDQAAYMKQRLLHSVSISNLRYLLDFARKDEKLMKTDCVRTFDITNLISACCAEDIAAEHYMEATKPTTRTRATFDNKINNYRHKLEAAYREVLIAKDKKNLTPYFKRQLQSKKSNRSIVVRDSKGKQLTMELLSERSGESNRSVSGSISELVSRSTTCSEGTYDLLEHIKTDDEAHIYERQPSYTVPIKDDENLLLNNMFSLVTIDDLTATTITSKTAVHKKGKTILAEKSHTQNCKDVKRPESKLRFAENPMEDIEDPEVNQDFPTTPNTSPTVSLDETFENNSVQKPETAGCIRDLQDSLKTLVLQGAREEDLISSPQKVDETCDMFNNNCFAADRELSDGNRISKQIERLFNIIHKKKTEGKIAEAVPIAPVHEDISSGTSDSLEYEMGTDFGKDYVTSPSLQTVTSLMLKPSVLQQFTNFEIQALLDEAGITPLMYHEISEVNLVKQLVGLAGVSPYQKKDKYPQEAEFSQYEGIICDKKVRGDEEDPLRNDEGNLETDTSSSSSDNVNECKEMIAGEEEVPEEEQTEEEDSTSSGPSEISLKSIHRGPQHSQFSIRTSVFDFPITCHDEKEIPRDVSMIPLINEKSLLRAIKKGLKRITGDLSQTVEQTDNQNQEKITVDMTSSISSSDVLLSYYNSFSSDGRTDSTSDRTATLPTIKSRDRMSVESPTPYSSTSTVNISPSLKVFRDRSSFESKFYNIMVESVGVSTAAKKEAEIGTDLSYGDEPDDV